MIELLNFFFAVVFVRFIVFFFGFENIAVGIFFREIDLGILLNFVLVKVWFWVIVIGVKFVLFI